MPELESEVTEDTIAIAIGLTVLLGTDTYQWNEEKKLFVNTETGKTLTARQVRSRLDELASELDTTTSETVLSEPSHIKREYTDFWNSFVAAMLAAYLLGLGGEENFTEDAKDTFNKLIREQSDYYKRFGADIIAGNLSLAQIADRFRMYAGANRGFYEQGRLFAYGGGRLVLPAYPGSVTCGNNCKCYLNIREYVDRWEVTWVRTAKESCEDCKYYGSSWQPYVVYK